MQSVFEYIYNGRWSRYWEILTETVLPDIFFAGNIVSSKLFLNKGDFRFEGRNISSQSKYHIMVHGCCGSTILNQDGWMDIYVSTVHPDPIRNQSQSCCSVNKGIDKNGVYPYLTKLPPQTGLGSKYIQHASIFFGL